MTMSGPLTKRQNVRETIIALMRGYYACPIISFLFQTRIVERIFKGPFSSGDFDDIQDVGRFEAILDYLISLGLLERIAGSSLYELSPLGRQVLQRQGGFSILHSYHEYFENLEGLLLRRNKEEPSVDRLENITGCADLHTRKFFLPASKILTDLGVTFLVDLGCGTGRFLFTILEEQPALRGCGVDISEAVAKTFWNEGNQFRDRLAFVHGDAFDLHSWAPSVQACVRPYDRVIISMWFLIHELRSGRVDAAVAFVQQCAKLLPGARLLIADLVMAQPEEYQPSLQTSIMPELLLFHRLSGQQVLTPHEWEEFLRRVPYRREVDVKFDPILSQAGEERSSSFLWVLVPTI